jgi:hypothetical protein
MMSKIGNFVLELQEQGALLPENAHNDCEPDFMDYAKSYMATDEYAKEHDEQTQRSIESFLESVRGHHEC